MPRLAVSGPLDHASGAGTPPERRTIKNLGTAGRLAPAYPLMGGHRPGWGLVSLVGASTQYRVANGECVAARIGGSLLRAGVASSATWVAANRDPYEFLRLALERWVAESGGMILKENFPMTLTLSSNVDAFSCEAVDDGHAYLIADPSQSGYLVMGPVLRLLEEEHPRLPATFYRLFIGAINRWARVFDYQDALERNEMLQEWYEGDPDAADIELPDIESAIPRCLRKKALSPRSLRQLMNRIGSSDVRSWVEGVLALHEESNRCSPAQLDSAIRDQFYDWNPPLPVLLTVFEKHDEIEGAFDEAAQGMLEASPEPNLILPFRPDDVAQVRDAFATLRCFCRSLALASELMKRLPVNAN
jgi:hypothetical protein